MKRFLIISLSVMVLLLLLVFVSRGCGRPKAKTTFYVARDPSFYPANLVGKDKNILAFSDALLLSIAAEEKLLVELHSVGASAIDYAVEKDEYDAMLSPLYPSPLNRERFLFSDCYFFIGPVLLVKEDSPVTKIEDMKDKRVGLQTSTLIVFDIASYPAIILQRFNSPVEALDSLVHGDIDGLVMDLIPAYSYVEGLYAGSVKVVGRPLNEEGLRLIGNKDSSAMLIEQFNEGLKRYREKGSFQTLLRQWDLHNPN